MLFNLINYLRKIKHTFIGYFSTQKCTETLEKNLKILMFIYFYFVKEKRYDVDF